MVRDIRSVHISSHQRVLAHLTLHCSLYCIVLLSVMFSHVRAKWRLTHILTLDLLTNWPTTARVRFNLSVLDVSSFFVSQRCAQTSFIRLSRCVIWMFLLLMWDYIILANSWLWQLERHLRMSCAERSRFESQTNLSFLCSISPCTESVLSPILSMSFPYRSMAYEDEEDRIKKTNLLKKRGKSNDLIVLSPLPVFSNSVCSSSTQAFGPHGRSNEKKY